MLRPGVAQDVSRPLREVPILGGGWRQAPSRIAFDAPQRIKVAARSEPMPDTAGIAPMRDRSPGNHFVPNAACSTPESKPEPAEPVVAKRYSAAE